MYFGVCVCVCRQSTRCKCRTGEGMESGLYVDGSVLRGGADGESKGIDT